MLGANKTRAELFVMTVPTSVSCVMNRIMGPCHQGRLKNDWVEYLVGAIENR